MKQVSVEIAYRALDHWGADPSSLAFVAASGNTVFCFSDRDEPRILRLTDPGHRTAEENRAEMAFLLHLASLGNQVSSPVPALSGRWVEEIDGCSASVLTWAPGVHVEPHSVHWDERFFREWGRSLAEIHRAARSYSGPPRWEWWQEALIADAAGLIPADDAIARDQLERVMDQLRPLPRHSQTYGMIHADFAPQNFHYDPVAGITSFDFGNCCHHWFASDLAISLSTLRRHADRDRYRTWILQGYEAVMPLDPAISAYLTWFMRLRILYVYLSRLKKFGPSPTGEEMEVLADLRRRVAERFVWK